MCFTLELQSGDSLRHVAVLTKRNVYSSLSVRVFLVWPHHVKCKCWLPCMQIVSGSIAVDVRQVSWSCQTSRDQCLLYRPTSQRVRFPLESCSTTSMSLRLAKTRMSTAKPNRLQRESAWSFIETKYFSFECIAQCWILML